MEAILGVSNSSPKHVVVFYCGLVILNKRFAAYNLPWNGLLVLESYGISRACRFTFFDYRARLTCSITSTSYGASTSHRMQVRPHDRRG